MNRDTLFNAAGLAGAVLFGGVLLLIAADSGPIVFRPDVVYAILIGVLLAIPPVGRLLEGDARRGARWRRWQWLALGVLGLFVVTGAAFLATGSTGLQVRLFTVLAAVVIVLALYAGRWRPKRSSSA